MAAESEQVDQATSCTECGGDLLISEAGESVCQMCGLVQSDILPENTYTQWQNRNQARPIVALPTRAYTPEEESARKHHEPMGLKMGLRTKYNYFEAQTGEMQQLFRRLKRREMYLVKHDERVNRDIFNTLVTTSRIYELLSYTLIYEIYQRFGRYYEIFERKYSIRGLILVITYNVLIENELIRTPEEFVRLSGCADFITIRNKLCGRCPDLINYSDQRTILPTLIYQIAEIANYVEYAPKAIQAAQVTHFLNSTAKIKAILSLFLILPRTKKWEFAEMMCDYFQISMSCFGENHLKLFRRHPQLRSRLFSLNLHSLEDTIQRLDSTIPPKIVLEVFDKFIKLIRPTAFIRIGNNFQFLLYFALYSLGCDFPSTLYTPLESFIIQAMNNFCFLPQFCEAYFPYSVPEIPHLWQEASELSPYARHICFKYRKEPGWQSITFDDIEQLAYAIKNNIKNNEIYQLFFAAE